MLKLMKCAVLFRQRQQCHLNNITNDKGRHIWNKATEKKCKFFAKDKEKHKIGIINVSCINYVYIYLHCLMREWKKINFCCCKIKILPKKNPVFVFHVMRNFFFNFLKGKWLSHARETSEIWDEAEEWQQKISNH